MPELSEHIRRWIHLQHPTTGQTENQARWQYMMLDLAEELERHGTRLDNLEAKQTPVNRRFVEEALGQVIAISRSLSGREYGYITDPACNLLIRTLRRALGEESDAKPK